MTKPTKEFVDSLGRRKVKGNMDIELAVDAMEMAEHIDHMVLFSGDGDFRSLVEAVQRKGVRVSVISTITTQPPMIADELRRQADEFIDLIHLVGKIGRDPGERAERMQRFQERRPMPQTAASGSRRRRRVENRLVEMQKVVASLSGSDGFLFSLRHLGMEGASAFPRRFARAYPLSRISRPFSRFQSRFFSTSRLSCSFLPRPSAIWILARPRALK